MSDADTHTADEQTAPTAEAAADTPPLPEEWKPEPRKWEWKDLFVTPMLAFKPKVMLVSAATLILMTLVSSGWSHLTAKCFENNIYVLNTAMVFIGLFILAVIFSLGASLVAIFMKADQLDDEFLSLKEALGQWGKRLKAALLVPVFLVGIIAGFYVLIYICLLLCSIPLVGPLLYNLLYLFGLMFALLWVMLCIAVALGFFVFPAIVAVRKHGWFDNVIDTFEAVGTKTHIVVLNLALTGVFMFVAWGLVNGSALVLTGIAGGEPNLPGNVALLSDAYSNEHTTSVLEYIMPSSVFPAPAANAMVPEDSIWGSWICGVIGTVMKVLVGVLLGGYLFNLFVGGGMMTYLTVREDDYWDDEDLEDLDKLAKELEEEAKAEAEKAEQEAKAETPEEKADAASTAEEPEASEEKEQGKEKEDDAESGASTGEPAEDDDSENKGAKKAAKKKGGKKKAAKKKEAKKKSAKKKSGTKTDADDDDQSDQSSDDDTD